MVKIFLQQALMTNSVYVAKSTDSEELPPVGKIAYFLVIWSMPGAKHLLPRDIPTPSR